MWPTHDFLFQLSICLGPWGPWGDTCDTPGPETVHLARLDVVLVDLGVMPPPFKGAPGVTILVLLRAIVPRAITIYDFTCFRKFHNFSEPYFIKIIPGK